MTDIQNLTPADLAALLAQGGTTLVDVREPAEFAAAHIDGAVLHPLSSFDPAALPPGPIVFQCGSGKRSLTAIQAAQAAGLPHHAHLQGGIQAWHREGRPLVHGS